jgi:hypothetical protein
MKHRLPWLILGVLLLLAGLLADRTPLGSSPGIGRTQAECLLIGSVTTVVYLVRRRPSFTFALLSRAALASLLLLMAVEAVSAVALQRQGGSSVSMENRRLPSRHLPVMSYSPFVLARVPAAACDSLATCDSLSSRTTTGIPPSDQPAFEIWVAGGTAVWGAGSPDSSTIPSELQRTLDTMVDYPVRVRNTGQPGWTTTQSLMQLVLELGVSRHPDLVVFYGVTDDYASAFAGGAGSLLLEQAMGELAETGGIARRFPDQPGDDILVRFSLPALVTGYRRQTPSSLPLLTDLTGDRAPGPDSILIEQTSGVIRGNYLVSMALGRRFGFRTALVIEPCLAFPPSSPSPEPADCRDMRRLGPGAQYMRDSFDALESWMCGGLYPGFIDMRSAFDGPGDSAYSDTLLLTPLGNGVAGRALAESLVSNGLVPISGWSGVR